MFIEYNSSSTIIKYEGSVMKNLYLILSICLLAACGKGFSGKYVDGSGMMSYDFKSNGKVIYSAMGINIESDFEVKGKDLKLNMQGAKMILHIEQDGSIKGPMGIKLIKTD